jgi:hypothetical protein
VDGVRWLVALIAAAGCTTLGPMPAMTGVTPVPPERTGVELQFAGMPGYFLSSTVKVQNDGATIAQGAAVVEIGRAIGAPGIALGGRWVGDPDEGGYPEPMLGYRRFLDSSKRFALAAIVFGTYGTGSKNGASYDAVRTGLELGLDARITRESRVFEAHAVAGVSGIALWAEGTYCLDMEGRFGTDCANTPNNLVAHVKGSGLYPALLVGLAADSGRHLGGWFHGVRAAIFVAAGAMPRVEAGVQRDATNYAAAGFSITLGLGASR